MAFTTSTYQINGLKCASCQLLIENTLSDLPEVKFAKVSLSSRTLVLRHSSSSSFSPEKLNRLFSSHGYTFFQGQNPAACQVQPPPNPLYIFIASLVFVFAFVLIHQFNLAALVSVNSTSSLPVFFLFGLLAGFSTCAALTGGLLLSLSRSWQSKPFSHLNFHLGRLLSFTLLGALLGSLGSVFRLSPTFTATLIILLSLGMIILALQMLGFRSLLFIPLRLPSRLTRPLSSPAIAGKFGPLLIGALTFFLPCGFTITAQALALASGSFLSGALILLAFALGTFPGLLLISLSSLKFSAHPTLSSYFTTTAGFIVLFFALFNLNSQLAVLNIPNFGDLLASPGSSLSSGQDQDLPPIINGRQLVKMNASSSGYTPSRLKIRSKIPVRWEITDRGTSGCTNAVISKDLFDGPIDLVPGTTSVKEFTASRPGIYKFSCWMGMVSGTFEVVD